MSFADTVSSSYPISKTGRKKVKWKRKRWENTEIKLKKYCILLCKWNSGVGQTTNEPKDWNTNRHKVNSRVPCIQQTHNIHIAQIILAHCHLMCALIIMVFVCGLCGVSVSWQNGSAFQRKYAILNFQFTSESNRSYPVAARVYLLPYRLFFMFLSLFLVIHSTLNVFYCLRRSESKSKRKALHVLTANRQKRMFMFQTAREHNGQIESLQYSFFHRRSRRDKNVTRTTQEHIIHL